MKLVTGGLAGLAATLVASSAFASSNGPPDADPAVFFGVFMAVMVGIILFLVVVPVGFHIWALIDVSQTRDDLFGPPWDNSKQSWTLGLAVAFFVPFGHILVPILWWTQVRSPRQRGEAIRRPFWMSAPVGPPPGAYQQPPPGTPPMR